MDNEILNNDIELTLTDPSSITRNFLANVKSEITRKNDIPLSVCCIFKTDDSDYLNGLINSLPDGVEIILCQTLENTDINTSLELIGEIQYIENSILKNFCYTFPKNDFSFSTARNACKSKATRDWILFLDADERLSNIDVYDLKHTFATMPEDVGGLNVGVCSYTTTNSEGYKWDLSPITRLYRNNPKFNYVFRGHEQIIYSILKEGFKLASCPLLIHHLGYMIADKNEIINKLKRNITLILKDLNEYKTDTDLFSSREGQYQLMMISNHLKSLQDCGQIQKREPQQWQ